MQENTVSRRGVYKDLSLSPYEFTSPYGDSFKFPSAKKLEIYERDVRKEIDRLSRFLAKSGLDAHLPAEIVQLMYRTTYHAFYDNVGA